MTLGEKQNGKVRTLIKDKHMPDTMMSTGDTSVLTQLRSSELLETEQQQQMEKGPYDKNNTIIKNAKQTDSTISFLRSARSGDLEKVIEFIESGQITDINTCNANGLNALHLAAKDGYIDIVNELLRRGAKVDNATKKGNTALHIASLAGQKEVIKLLIQYNANVNVQSLNGFTPLYMAAQENHDACVRYLLAKGANPSLATEDGFTPLAVAMQQGHDKVVAVLLESDSRGKVRLPALHIAAKKDDVKAATLLLENEHNPDIVSKSGFTPLHIAAHYGNVNIANLLIDRGADVNYIAKHNITPLHVACKWGKTNILKLLLSKHARIDATTRDGLTPLHCAARSGHKEVIEILLANEAPILSKTKNGLAPLHMTAQGEHDEAARILLVHKAPVDEVTVDYLTALHVSAHCGHVRVAKLLLDYNADPNARALNGFTPLHIACKKNRIKVVELLLKHNASISATTESGLTPLHVASFMGCMNIVIYLLQHDANPDAPTVRGETPLHLAARANQTDIIRILLRNGAQVDSKAREGQTPLHVASRLGNNDIIMLLLQHGADVDASTKDAYTPLHIAAKEGQDEVAQLLIENNAKLDATTKKGFSPMHLAAKYGKVQVVRLLLQKGATVDCQGKNGVTPLHVAAHYDHQNVALLLLERGAQPHISAKNGHTALHIAAKKNQVEIAQNLLQYSADPNVRSKSGFAPLHLAAQEGNIDMVNLLLEHGADANLMAKNGLTPLHLCAQEDNTNVAQVLLANKANISERTMAGYTPLHVAAHYGQINMVKYLLENDASIEMSTNIGYTPLHQAAQQGHTLVINLLLTHKADPNALTKNGQTALSIADKLGYVTAVETLKIVTEKSVTNIVTGVLEEKYKVVAPESMHEAFMSDSEDEGGDDHLDQHQYKYMATDELKRIINEHDQQNYDTTDNDEHDGAHVISNGRNAVNENMSKAYINYNVSASNPYTIKQADNVVIARPPIHLGFLVSFLVDARGGAMRGCRHSGVRVIVPPKACAQPTRITCRYVKLQRVPNPPPLMEGEALVSRIMELSPVEAKFLSPVILEVPHFGSLRDKEREIIILRSDNGESWREHTLNDSQDAVRDVLSESFDGGELNPLEDLHTNRIIRVSTRKFPHFFAVVSRIRQEVHAIGPDGGTVSSQAVPQVQAIFPPHALTKKIRVGLQAQPVDLNGCCKLLGRGVAVSPVVTVEPRRRKFHKAITLSIPAPKAYSQGMVNSQYSGTAPTLRLLCSITGGQNRAIWEDVTGSTPLAFVKDSVSFTTTVSARFWLMDCRNITDASRMATELYSYMAQVPFMVKFVVFAKRISHNEAKFSVFCMTDDKEDKTLEQQEYFTEVAKSRDIEVLEDQDIYLEFAGNLVPVLKSGEQLNMKFQAFRENRLSFVVHVKDQEEPYGRVTFMSEPKAGKGEPPQQPICSLNVSLEGHEIVESTNRNNDSQRSLNTITLDRGLNYRDLINFGYNLKKGTAALESAGVGRAEVADTIHKADIRLSDICNLLESDWVPLALELNVPVTDIELIKTEYVDHPSQQAMVMLRLWLQQQGPQANGNSLEQALHIIGRSDIVKQCMFNLELVTDDMERALAKEQLDQSLIDGLHADLNYENGNSPKSDPLGVPNTNTNTNGNKLAHTMQHDVSALNDTLQSEFSYAEKVDDDAESENQFKYDNGDKLDEFCVIECTTLPPNTNASTKTNTVTGTDYGMETIPPKAEESTKLLLKDTHQKIDESVHHPEASTSHKEGKQSSPSLLPESLQRTIETTFDIKAPHEWPADNPVEDGLISASAPLDQLTKTIKRGSHMAIKSKIPRPTIDDINWTVTNDANMADVVGDARVTEISSVNLDDVVEFDDVTSMKYNVENISRSSSYYDVACENNQCVETLQIDSADRLLASQTTTPITATTTASTNSKQQTKYTDTARNADGSETQFSSSEERKTNEAGENISQLHRAGNVGDNTVVGDIIVGQNVSRDSSEAPPFFQALTADSIKPQKSSTKSWENSIENKALCSSSESDLALHEPGMELSEDDDADTVDTDFYQDAVKSANSITTETVTLFKDNGSSTCTTTPTHFVTKVGHMCSEEELTGMESKVMQPLSEVDLSTGSTTASRTITRKLTQDSENLKSDEGKSPELLITNIITQTRQTGDRVFGKADEELLKLSINSESVQNRCGSVHFTRQEEQK